MSTNKIEEIEQLEFVPVGKAKDLTGKEFGRLKVLGRAPSNTRYAHWWCICSCPEQNIISVIGSHLLSGETKSCGCYNKEVVSAIGRRTKKDLTGQIFGNLLVLEDDGTRDLSHRSVKWKCKCACGNIIYVRTDELNSWHTLSCGCQNSSIGEEIIKKILDNNNVNYIKEYAPKDLHYKDNPLSHPRFDFYLPDHNKIIEFDGYQHFYETKFFNLESLETRKDRDNQKNEYCLKKGIFLQRIPYWDINKIDKEYLGL